MSKKMCALAVLLGFFGVEICAAEPCGNTNSYIDQLCRHKQRGDRLAGGSSGGTKMPSTPLVQDFEIEPFADEGGSKKGTSPFKW